MPESQNINTSDQAIIGHKFSILGHKSSIWFKQHLPPPAAYSPLYLPLTSVMEWIPNLGTEQTQEIIQGEKIQEDAYSARSALQSESLHGCTSACRGKEGPGGGIFGQLTCKPSFGLRIWFHISYIRGTRCLWNLFPTPYLWVVFSQLGSQSAPANNGTDTTKGMVQRQELPNAVLPQGKKDEIVPLN